jgi:threonine aldolase
VYPVDTNIVIFTLKPQYDALSVQDQLKSSGLLISSMGGGVLRLVTHLDVNQQDVDWVCRLLKELEI